MNKKRQTTTPLRFAHIGAGRMAKRWVEVIEQSDQAKLIWTVDSGSGRAKELAETIPGCSGTSEIEDVLRDETIVAVIVSTSHKYLSEITNKALMANKHVLCEKPGALKAKDIKKAIDLAQKMKRTYMVGYNHRFHDGFLKARELFDKGHIGELLFIRASYGFGGRKGYDTEWRLDPRTSGGGHLIDQGVHMIDLCLSYLGKPQQIKGMISDLYWKQGAEDNAFVLLQGENKTIASIHTSLTQWDPMHRFEIYGTLGYLVVHGLGKKYGGGEKLLVGLRSDDYSSANETVIECDSNADSSLALELEEFISAICEERQVSPSPIEAYKTLMVVESVYKNK